MAFHSVQFYHSEMWRLNFHQKVIVFATCSVWFSVFISIIPARGYSAADSRPPHTVALMVELDQLTSHSPELVNAIRAQLSASRIDIQNVPIRSEKMNLNAPQTGLKNLARQFGAQFVFFVVEDAESCSISFFVNEDTNGELFVRRLTLQSRNRASRFETIANAVASMLEDATTGPLRPSESLQPATPAPVARPKKQVKTTREGHYSELSAFYKGSLFSNSQLAHGIGGSLGVFPLTGLVIRISYNQNFALKWQTESYLFSIRSGAVNASIAKVFVNQIFEFQLGISWNTTFRSYEITIRDGSLNHRRPDSNAIHAIEPFGEIAWHFHENIWLVWRAGASVSLNEKNYLISRDDDTSETVVRPYLVKPIYRLGFVIQL